MASIYTYFEGAASAPKNAILRSKFSKKCLKTPFFKNLLAEQKIWLYYGLYNHLGDLRKFGRPKNMNNLSIGDFFVFFAQRFYSKKKS